MALDFSGLAALSGQDNWEQKRQDRNASLQYVAIQNAMAEQKNQKQIQSEAAVQEYLNTAGKINVLSQDKAKIQAKEKELSGTIQEGIKNSHGNIAKYLQTGGLTELNKYRTGLLDSEEVQRGLINAYNHNRATADQQAGLTQRPTSWQEGDNTVQGSYADNYKAFTEEKTSDLNYQGAFKMPEFNSKVFGERYANPNMDYKAVTPQEVATEAYSQFKGLPEQDRRHAAVLHASNYAQGLEAGNTPLSYKFADPEKRKLEAANLAIRYQTAQAKLSKALKGDTDYYGEIMSGGNGTPADMKVDAGAYNQAFGEPTDQKAIGQQLTVPAGITPMGEASLKHDYGSLEGLTYNKKNGNYDGTLSNGDGARSYDNFAPIKGLNGVPYKVNNIEGIVHMPGPDGKGQQNYALMDVTMKTGDAENTGLEKGYNLHWTHGNYKILVPANHKPYEVQIFQNKYKTIAKQDSAYGNKQELLNSPAQSGYLNNSVTGDEETRSPLYLKQRKQTNNASY